MTTSTHRDPRRIITPDAFEVEDYLMGLLLASPRRRAVALAIDVAFIGFMTAVMKSFGGAAPSRMWRSRPGSKMKRENS